MNAKGNVARWQRLIYTTVSNLSKNKPNVKGKNVTAQNWIMRQASDPYVKKANEQNFRCRSAFKLIEMDDKVKILKPGVVVVDCGAAPGSWCQVAVQRVNALNKDPNLPVGKVIGVDLQHMIPVPGAVTLYNADFTLPDTQKQIINILNGQKAGVVLSDMAPSATGIKSMDHELIIQLCVSALRFSTFVLKKDGSFICKIWQGNEQKKLELALKKYFTSVKILKPNSSRSDSAEVFFVAKGLL